MLGTQGRFWRAGGETRQVSPARFREPDPPGTAKAVWNFTVERRAGAHNSEPRPASSARTQPVGGACDSSLQYGCWPRAQDRLSLRNDSPDNVSRWLDTVDQPSTVASEYLGRSHVTRP